jgi:hypothetical protein
LVNNNLSRHDILLIQDRQINIDFDIFFEMLINHVRNELVSYQAFLKKFISKGKRDLINSLVELRQNFNVNFQAIQEVELQLQQISEAEIENILETSPIFEHINNKKMSPLLLKLAKSNTGGSSLSQVRDENDEPFRSEQDRDEYIVRHFEKIYSVPVDAPLNFEGCIERFLGENICNNIIVQACKLTDAERVSLDHDFSIQELDAAAKKGKTGTACGSDRLNNLFVKKFWSFFREPLFRYTTTCFEKKRLTDSFRQANIRLIPKKGDTGKITNWRPISLLNCFYKVISRAVNNRLKNSAADSPVELRRALHLIVTFRR